MASSSGWPWLAEGLQNITQAYNPPVEYGLDMGLPMGTPITSLTTGTVLGSGYYGGGGVVSVASHVNGKTVSVYYQHLDLIASGIKPGALVTVGQLLGYSGGQLSGGNHPSTPAFSSGPHIEVGINAPYGGMWAPLGPNEDPTGWLVNLNANGAPTTGFVGTTMMAVNNQVPGMAGLLETLHQAEEWQGFNITNPLGSFFGSSRAIVFRATVVVIGVIIIAAIAFNALSQNLEAGFETAAPAALGALA